MAAVGLSAGVEVGRASVLQVLNLREDEIWVSELDSYSAARTSERLRSGLHVSASWCLAVAAWSSLVGQEQRQCGCTCSECMCREAIHRRFISRLLSSTSAARRSLLRGQPAGCWQVHVALNRLGHLVQCKHWGFRV